MKRVVTIASLLAVLFAVPAVAGPDWNVIQEGEANKLAHEHQAAVEHLPISEALPLDHGPRALTTPWMNEERRAEIASQLKKKEAVLSAHTAHNLSHS